MKKKSTKPISIDLPPVDRSIDSASVNPAPSPLPNSFNYYINPDSTDVIFFSVHKGSEEFCKIGSLNIGGVEKPTPHDGSMLRIPIDISSSLEMSVLNCIFVITILKKGDLASLPFRTISILMEGGPEQPLGGTGCFELTYPMDSGVTTVNAYINFWEAPEKNEKAEKDRGRVS